MWANAQRMAALPNIVGGLVPSVQCCKVWLMPATTVPCSNASKTRNPLKFAGVPQTNEPLVGQSSPYYEDTWRRYCCLTSCAMVPRWRFFASSISSELRAVHFRPAF